MKATGNGGQSTGSDVVLQHGQTLFLANGFIGASSNKFYSLISKGKKYNFLQGKKWLSGYVLS